MTALSFPQLPESPVKLALPLFISVVPAGFPSAADDFIDVHLDLNEHLVKHPSATYFVKASGGSMIGAGIMDGDLLMVDRDLPYKHGNIVVASIDGELTCKRLDLRRQLLVPSNSKCQPISITDNSEVIILGVVIHSIRNHLGG